MNPEGRGFDGLREAARRWTLICLGAVLLAPGLWADGADPDPAGVASAEVATLDPLRTERILHAVTWLSDDAREGRGVGTQGLAEAEAWIAKQMAEMGLAPGGTDGFFHSLEVPTRVSLAEGAQVLLDGHKLPGDSWLPASFSASGELEAEVLAAGYGISAEDLNHDDYADLDVSGKVVAVRRFVPPGARFADADNARRFSDLRYKAFNAREKGAVGLLVVDWPELASGEEMPDEAALPDLKVDSKGDSGLPVIVLQRRVGKALFEGGHRIALSFTVDLESTPARNVVGRIVAEKAAPRSAGRPSSGHSSSEGEAGQAQESRGAILIGAHFDHLGYGGRGSLEPDSGEVHNGADDNASGTAAMLELARTLVEHRAELERDIWLVAFTAEESGLLGSSALVRQPPPGLDPASLLAMINFDMVGRLEGRDVQALGAASAEEWSELVPPACEEAGLGCRLGGDGYGPSDQTPFYAAGVPVLHWFTGTHADYHRPSDDAGEIDNEGIARIVGANSALVTALASREEGLTYVSAEAPKSGGDVRSFGASLGTIPDYAGSERPGVLVSGARPGSAADRAGVQAGDLLVGLGDKEIRNIYDFVYVLRSAKPGETTTLTVMRGEERLELEVTYDEGRRRP